MGLLTLAALARCETAGGGASPPKQRVTTNHAIAPPLTFAFFSRGATSERETESKSHRLSQSRARDAPWNLLPARRPPSAVGRRRFPPPKKTPLLFTPTPPPPPLPQKTNKPNKTAVQGRAVPQPGAAQLGAVHVCALWRKGAPPPPLQVPRRAVPRGARGEFVRFFGDRLCRWPAGAALCAVAVASCSLLHTHTHNQTTNTHHQTLHKKKKTVCPRGEDCPCTHSLFEYWLHPERCVLLCCVCVLLRLSVLSALCASRPRFPRGACMPATHTTHNPPSHPHPPPPKKNK